MSEFDSARALAGHFDYVAETGSTNTDLIAAAANLPDFAVRVAGFQNAGRGRSGRQWLAPAGSSLFVSVLLRPRPAMQPDAYGWLPLIAGLAMRNAVAELAAASGRELQVAVKWPNDVLIAEADAAEFGGHRKVSGVLSELLPDLSGVVIGAGLNLTQTAEQLPIESATSLARNGVAVDRETALAAYLNQLKGLYGVFVAAGGDAVASGLRDQIAANCASVGRRVRTILPGDVERLGAAKGIDSQGRLIVLFDGDSAPTAVAAGDIVHLRHN
ncbi:MAG: hypothetical protein RL102_953 [Actinomycetota bacterium]|jgi:BirA family biotin operon repressor/biotin-[acetyl-CoA-carboxylase] ligase